MLEGINTDEVGPTRIESGMRLSDIVRKVNADGLSLDEVVVVATGELELDWAKDWENGKRLTDDEKKLTPAERERRERDRAEAEMRAARREAEVERTDEDPTEGW